MADLDFKDIAGDPGALETEPERKALEIVMRDFKRAYQHLQPWHRECIERYKHYKACGAPYNLLRENKFPVPFTSKQVDQLRADMIEKLWYRGEPCSLYGREKTDQMDAEAKKEFMKYQDDQDNLFEKTDQAIFNCAIYGMAPTVVNFKAEYTIEFVDEEQPVYMQGQPLMEVDGMTPMVQVVKVARPVPTYLGATVELVDPIDFFYTPEKRSVHDEHPMMIFSKRSMAWFKKQPYIMKHKLSALESEYRTTERAVNLDDYLTERREVFGDNVRVDGPTGEYEYIEWQGWADLDGKRKLWILGVADQKEVVRMDVSSYGDDRDENDEDPVFDLGHPNIVIGTIGRELGEVKGESLLDKIRSLQHGMDTLMGMWLKALRQTVNPMWKGNSDYLRNKRLVNEAGSFIDCKGNIDEAVQRVEQEQISKDIYAGMEMFENMGRGATGMTDIQEGEAQQGVETLGEASILQTQSSLRPKRYLRSFEKSWIEPVWAMRNQINMRFCQDPGYLYKVIGERVVYWRTLTPAQVRADVDFVCEASNRENHRGVITQQILQSIKLMSPLIQLIGPDPVLQLFRKLYKEAFGWKSDEIDEILRPDVMMQAMMNNAMMQGGMGGAGGIAQPRTEGQARMSMEKKNQPQVGVMQ